MKGQNVLEIRIYKTVSNGLNKYFAFAPTARILNLAERRNCGKDICFMIISNKNLKKIMDIDLFVIPRYLTIHLTIAHLKDVIPKVLKDNCGSEEEQ